MDRGGGHIERVELGEESIVVGDCAFLINCSLLRSVKDVVEELRRRPVFHFFDVRLIHSYV